MGCDKTVDLKSLSHVPSYVISATTSLSFLKLKIIIIYDHRTKYLTDVEAQCRSAMMPGPENKVVGPCFR